MLKLIEIQAHNHLHALVLDLYNLLVVISIMLSDTHLQYSSVASS